MEPRLPIRLAPAAAALVACVALGWIAFGRGGRVPLLANVDFGVHEFGHLLFAWGPPMLVASAGSLVQVALPLGLAAYFGLVRRELLSAAVLLAWAATSAQNVSVYVADAPVQALPLWADGVHDWAFLLGPGGLDVIHAAPGLARAVWLLGLAMLIAAVALCLRVLAAPAFAAREEEAWVERLASLPVREPSTPDARRPEAGGD